MIRRRNAARQLANQSHLDATVSRLGVDGQGASRRSGQTMDEAKAEAGVAHGIKARRKAAAFIFDEDFDPAGLPRQRYPDVSGTVFDCVGYQFRDDRTERDEHVAVQRECRAGRQLQPASVVGTQQRVVQVPQQTRQVVSRGLSAMRAVAIEMFVNSRDAVDAACRGIKRMSGLRMVRLARLELQRTGNEVEAVSHAMMQFLYLQSLDGRRFDQRDIPGFWKGVNTWFHGDGKKEACCWAVFSMTQCHWVPTAG